jgi:hypothetical protein
MYCGRRVSKEIVPISYFHFPIVFSVALLNILQMTEKAFPSVQCRRTRARWQRTTSILSRKTKARKFGGKEVVVTRGRTGLAEFANPRSEDGNLGLEIGRY